MTTILLWVLLSLRAEAKAEAKQAPRHFHIPSSKWLPSGYFIKCFSNGIVETCSVLHLMKQIKKFTERFMSQLKTMITFMQQRPRELVWPQLGICSMLDNCFVDYCVMFVRQIGTLLIFCLYFPSLEADYFKLDWVGESVLENLRSLWKQKAHWRLLLAVFKESAIKVL